VLTAPQGNNQRDFVSVINSLPETDNPLLFGLPSNIDRSVQRFNSNQVISQLKSLQAVSASELRFDKEKWNQQLGPICQLWNNVYKKQHMDQVKITEKDMRCEDPVDQFVYREMESVKSILRYVDNSV